LNSLEHGSGNELSMSLLEILFSLRRAAIKEVSAAVTAALG
jgi:hypothetical protein